MAYHITAAKLLKPCSCTSCRAKHGRFETLAEAEAKLAELTGRPTLPLQAELEDDLGFKRIVIPKTELADTSPGAAVVKEAPIEVETPEALVQVHEESLAEELTEGAADERFEETVTDLADDGGLEEEVKPKKSLRLHESLDDDEEFLRGDDVVLEVAPDSALIQQMDNVVSWHLENFYDEEGKPRGKYSLRGNPPVFRVEASDGASAEFLLTKDLTLSLAETFETVKRGYYGVNPRRRGMMTQEPPPSKVESVQLWASEHPLKAVVLFIMLVLCVITAAVL